MALQVSSGALLTCTFGAAPSQLTVLPKSRVNAGGPPAANIMDMVPQANIKPFGMCMSLANPAVAAATSAALGVLTPQACTPLPAGPWKPGSPTVLVGGMPALTNSCTANCAFGGLITIGAPGQFKVMTA